MILSEKCLVTHFDVYDLSPQVFARLIFLWQIRLTDGTTLKQTFSADEQLSAIRLYVEMNRSDGMGPFTFMTTFPRKVFTSEDMETPLKELGKAEVLLLLSFWI